MCVCVFVFVAGNLSGCAGLFAGGRRAIFECSGGPLLLVLASVRLMNLRFVQASNATAGDPNPAVFVAPEDQSSSVVLHNVEVHAPRTLCIPHCGALS